MAVCLPQSSPLQSQLKLQALPPQQQILLPELPAAVLPATVTNLLSTTGNSLLAAGGAQSGLTDDVPSCSTSPSTNNCVVLPQQMLNRTQQHNTVTQEKTAQSAMTILEALAAAPNTPKELPKTESCVKPSLPISSKMPNQGVVGQKAFLNNTTQMDYLDTSCSATSVCLSQTDGSLQQMFPPSSFNQPSMFRDAHADCDVSADPRNNVLFGVNIDGPLGIPDPLLANSIDSGKYQNNMSGNVVAKKDAQQELSSSMVSQSFGVADMAFNSIDSAITDSSFLNKNSWAPAPQFQRMRTYTKVRCFSF